MGRKKDDTVWPLRNGARSGRFRHERLKLFTAEVVMEMEGSEQPVMVSENLTLLFE